MRLLRPFSFLLLALLPVLTADVRAAGETPLAPATTLTPAQVLETLARDLSTHFNLDGELQLELLRAWTPPSRAASVWELNVLEFPARAASSMIVRCRLLGDSTPVGDTTFVVRASLWRDAWATRQPLTAGDIFSASLLEIRRIDMLRERDVLPASAGDDSFIFARAVPSGRLLTWRDVARRPLVKKGDLVEVSAADGLLVVTMKALAMQNGAKGETVTIRNPESRRDFVAVVIDENRVQVRF